MGAPVAVYPFDGCELWIWPETRYLETRWPDGSKCGATRDCELNNLSYARHLGYPDCWTAVVCHEALHHLIAQYLGHPYSPTLWAVARGYEEGTAPYEARLFEEALVLATERWLNTGDLSPILDHPSIRFRLPKIRKAWEPIRADLLTKARAA